MSIFTQFAKSLYSPKDMARYRFQKIGKAILYIFFITLLTTIPIMYQTYSIATKEFAFMKEVATNELPEFQIKNGIIETSDQKPVIKERADFTLIFDPTSESLPRVYEGSGYILALLKDKVIVNLPGQNQTIPYSTIGDLSLSKENIASTFTLLEQMGPIFLTIFMTILYLFTCFTNFLYVTLIALYTLFFAKQTMRTLSYKQAWVVTAYTITIPTVFFGIIEGLQIRLPISHFLLYNIVAIIVLVLTVLEIPKKKIK